MPKTSKIPPRKLELYDRLVATNSNIERKGVTLPYTSLNGNMFTFLSDTGSMAIRLPDEERERFRKKYRTKLYERQGTVLKEYVVVPARLLEKTKELKPYFDKSYEYTKTLKPKPTKRKK